MPQKRVGGGLNRFCKGRSEMQSRREDASEEISATAATVSFCCSRGLGGGGSEEVEGVFHELSLGIGEGCRGLQSALGSGGAWSANVCVCVTHRGVTTLTHTLPIGKMEHESACLTLQ